ncbi:hypothetical protein BDK51DRAFT_35223, partial [Blyttiomyces helicus]
MLLGSIVMFLRLIPEGDVRVHNWVYAGYVQGVGLQVGRGDGDDHDLGLINGYLVERVVDAILVVGDAVHLQVPAALVGNVVDGNLQVDTVLDNDDVGLLMLTGTPYSRLVDSGVLPVDDVPPVVYVGGYRLQLGLVLVTLEVMFRLMEYAMAILVLVLITTFVLT